MIQTDKVKKKPRVLRQISRLSGIYPLPEWGIDDLVQRRVANRGATEKCRSYAHLHQVTGAHAFTRIEPEETAVVCAKVVDW